MAFQHMDKRKGAQIVKTQAPDEISNIRRPGAFSPGTNGPQVSSVAPGVASESLLAQNLRQSQADSEDVLTTIIKQGVAGRGDSIPADGNLQLRSVSADMYPASHGAIRQQDPAAVFGKKKE
jgi:hypothetical protein